ncbi:MAG: hypothetical protein AAGA66_16355 [Bacteroidota bacterium]
MKTKSLIICVLTLSSFLSFGQKIKYKDLFPILDAKNWSEGGVTLRKFLADPKNAEFANAHLQMALMLEDRFNGIDIVADTVASINSGDSAVVYFKRAKELITEKELKKNDDYYQAFSRRDLRTGEFGIKVSDVHLDIEKKVEGIEKKIADARQLQKSVRSIESQNKEASEKYSKLVEDFGTYTTLLLAAVDKDIETLKSIRELGASASGAASEISELARQLGSSRYQGEVVIKEIETFGKDGIEQADLQSGTIELWNYEAWASDAFSEINGSIGLLKTMIMKHAKAIRGQKKIIVSGTDSVVDSLSQDLLTLFEKYDSESIAKRLLQLETSEVLIRKQVDILINKTLQDSTLVGAQLDVFTVALKEAEIMASVVESIAPDELKLAKKTYEEYIDSFFQKYATVSNFVKESREWVGRQQKWLGDAVDYWSERNRWGTDEEEDEKVPLYVQESPESKFFTIGMPVHSNEKVMVYGANMIDKKGFIYAFNENRDTKWKLEFELPGESSFKLKSDTIPTFKGSFGFYLLNESEKENNLSLTSFTETGGLNWSTVVTVPKPPVSLKFDDITQELTILLYPEEQLPLANNELGYIVIDRTGNAR